MNKKLTVLVLALITIPLGASADMIHFERGGASTVTGLVGKNRINYEGGLFSYADEFNGDKSYGFALGSSKVRYGLLDRLELRLTNSGLYIDDDIAGFANLGLGMKIAITEEEHGLMPIINLVTDWQIPFGREELENPGFTHSYLLAISHSITDRLTGLVDVGLAYAITDNLIFDTSINWGLNKPAPDFGVDFGFAVGL